MQPVNHRVDHSRVSDVNADSGGVRQMLACGPSPGRRWKIPVCSRVEHHATIPFGHCKRGSRFRLPGKSILSPCSVFLRQDYGSYVPFIMKLDLIGGNGSFPNKLLGSGMSSPLIVDEGLSTTR